MMKLLILGGSNSRNSGGIFVVAHKIGQKLRENYGIEVHFLMHEDEYSVEDAKVYEGAFLHTYKIYGPTNFVFSPDMYDIMCEIKPDLIHTQTLWMYNSFVVLKYKMNFNVPVIISPHGMLDEFQLRTSWWKKRIALFFYERKNLDTASCIHALCSSERNSVYNFVKNVPVATIPNGVDLPKVVDSPTSILPYWKKQDKKTLLFLSRVDKKKNIDSLIRAWNKSDWAAYNWQLVIAGEAKDSKYLELLNSLGGANNAVYFIGGQYGENKDITFRNADAFILPSYSEGLPMAVLEAWSYRKIALITPQCNLPEAFEKHASIKIETDVDSILSGLNHLFKMSLSEKSLIENNAYDLVRKKFTWDAVAEKMKLLYDFILNEGVIPDFIE